MEWGFNDEGLLRITLTFVEQSTERPNTVVTTINLLALEATTARYREYQTRGLSRVYRHIIVETLSDLSQEQDLRILVDGAKASSRLFKIRDAKSKIGYYVAIDVRLLGDDTGSDILVDVGGQLKGAVKHFNSSTRKPTPEEMAHMNFLMDSRPGA